MVHKSFVIETYLNVCNGLLGCGVHLTMLCCLFIIKLIFQYFNMKYVSEFIVTKPGKCTLLMTFFVPDLRNSRCHGSRSFYHTNENVTLVLSYTPTKSKMSSSETMSNEFKKS